MTIAVLGYTTTQDGKSKPLSLPDAWSYSKLADYEVCPARFAYKHIIKIPEGSNDAFVRGNMVHKLAQDYVEGTIPAAMPPELASFGSLFEILRSDTEGAFIEQQWAFAADWTVTGWFARPPAKKAWVRNIVDYGVNYGDGYVTLIDFKTGKKYDTNKDQVEQFGMSALLRFPEVNTVETRLWYLDTGDEIKSGEGKHDVPYINRTDLPRLKAKWKERVNPMFLDKQFAPRKNQKCKWCPFSGQNAGGPCRVG